MDFDFSDEQEMLRDSVRRWVEKGYDLERRRAIVKAGGYSEQAWAEMVELGLTGLQVSEAQGGLGFGPVEAMVVMEELGRGIVLEPYAEVALVATSLLKDADGGVGDQRLKGIAEGSERVVLAQQERHSRYRLAQVATKAERAGDGWKLNGRKIVVPAGAQATAFVVSARTGGAEDDAAGVALFLVAADAPGVSVRGYPRQDGASAADVELDGASATLLIAAGPA